jgi:excisionase family DNA binding protein
MRTLMTIQQVADYLQVSEKTVRRLVKNREIPFYDKLGEPRFFKDEIDKWLRTPGRHAENREIPFYDTPGELGLDREENDAGVRAAADRGQQVLEQTQDFLYRGRPIRDYTLSAARVLCGRPSWKRLPEFIRQAVKKVHESGREFLYREDFEPFLNNYNDYVRLCFWLGLIEKLREEKRAHYYLTEYARRICDKDDMQSIKRIILESILNVIANGLETHPDERHALLLLWYYLKLKHSQREVTESQFRLDKDKAGSAFPLIRLNFAKGFSAFLFDNDSTKEQEVLAKWDKYLEK